MVTVPLDMQGDYVNVRGGPGTEFPEIGRLEKGASAPAIGRVPGDWIMIQFPGGPEGIAWVYAGLVNVSGEIPDLSVPGSTQP
jgi:uncharacterized protein YraI